MLQKETLLHVLLTIAYAIHNLSLVKSIRNDKTAKVLCASAHFSDSYKSRFI